MTQTLRCALVGYGFIAGKGHAPVYAERSVGEGDFKIAAIVDSNEARRAASTAGFSARAYLQRPPGNAECRSRSHRLRGHHDPALCARQYRARRPRSGASRPMRKTDRSVYRRGGFTSGARATGKRVFFPCHNYKHAPVIKTVRSLIESGSIGRVHLVTLQTFRTTHARGVSEWRPDWRRERRFSGGGIAMDHGSHTLYLAFEWLGSHPVSVSAKANTLGDFDTEDNFSCTLTFPNGIATAQLTWTAGARKVMYTIMASTARSPWMTIKCSS